MSNINNGVLAMAAIGLLLQCWTVQCYSALQTGYYNKKCFTNRSGVFGFQRTSGEVNVEQTVREAMRTIFFRDPSIVAALLRMHFHDCFVKGCDASILLKENTDGTPTERAAIPNQSVRGYEVIDTIKTILEQNCKQVVSCADIIVMATREAVDLASIGKVRYVVETGRLDGKESLASNVNLPSPKISMSESIKAFDLKGLSVTDMVYLLGGHTVGVAHCGLFQYRLYNFKGTGKADPTMDPALVDQLRSRCPQGSTGSTSTPLDQNEETSSMEFDNSYYQQLLKNRGILEIDQLLATSGLTNKTVIQIAKGSDFGQNFGEAMLKLGRVDVITDPAMGEIRTSCSAVNKKVPVLL